MKLIEISPIEFINRESICSVKVYQNTETKIEDIGYGLQSSPGKVGEFFTLEIVTADGKAHRPDKVFSAQIFEEFFPTSQEAD